MTQDAATALAIWQYVLILLTVTGIIANLIASHKQTVFLVKQWEAHIALAREQQVTLIREALRPIKVHEHPCIMVIEDNDSMMALTRRQLTDQGYAVRPAISAEAALASLATSPELPDVVVVDIRLPRMNGIEFAKQLRHCGCRMPIIAYSAYGSGIGENTRDEAIQAGCNEFVAKGEKTMEGDNALIVTIARWLEITRKLEGRWDA